MGNAFLLKGKALCAECYETQVDYLTGREQVSPRRTVDATECDQCHAILEPEEEL